MKELKVVGVDELHNTMRDFIIESNTIVITRDINHHLIMVKAGLCLIWIVMIKRCDGRYYISTVPR